ncbi:hypothetical protein ACQPZG_18515 [Streptomyces sp. CA-294286]|uniref:hypothetical protein n=1 Tax=Streptomyces sp. CA-294286 TaxID=3240070 RepID=UPI003D92DCE3
MSLGEDDGRRGTDDPYTTMGGTRQTRTRMPDGDASPFRGRGPRTSRSMITVVGVVVLLVAAIAFANRGPANGPADQGGTRGAPPASDSTAATGERPVSGRAGGIPSGFARTQQGAESAAANYASVLGSDGMFNAGRRRGIVQTIADPGAVDRLQSGFDADYSANFLKQIGLDENGSAPTGMTFVNRTVPSGTKATSYSDDAASVDVWCMGLFGLAGDQSTKPVTSGWFTVSLKLRWSGSDWKVLETSQKQGPTPLTADNPASKSEEIADAVTEFGGFTYAR